MSDENKKLNSSTPKPQNNETKLPNLNNRGERGSYINGWEKANGKVHEILDKGHPGIPPPPQKPTEKK